MSDALVKILEDEIASIYAVDEVTLLEAAIAIRKKYILEER